MKAFLNRNKKGLLKLCGALLAVVAISLIALFIFTLTGVLYYDEGIQIRADIFSAFKESFIGWFIFMIMQTVFTMLLCFIPGVSMAFILLSNQLYQNDVEAFLLSFTSVMISSFAMYLLGRFGGYKICKEFLGEEDCAKATELLRNKGTVYFPLMMMFPMFPDDALIMIAGTSKMSLKWFLPSIVVGRGLGIAAIIFGISLIPFDSFTRPYDWFVFITVCLFWAITLIKCARLLNKKMEQRRNFFKEKQRSNLK